MREHASARKRSWFGALDAWSEANADRALRIGAVLLVVAIAGFAVFYYFDRFYAPNNVPIVDQGVARLEEMVRRDPRNADARVQLGFGYVEMGYNDEAIAQYEEALKINEKHQGALIGLGNAYMAKNDQHKALTFYLQVAELNKNNPYKKTLRVLETVYYNLAAIHLQRGRLDEAIDYAREAIDIERTDADALLVLGQALQAKGDHEGALTSFREATRLDPNFQDAYQAMATSYEVLKVPGGVLYAKGMAAYSVKNYHGAQRYLREAIAAAPQLAEAHQGLGLTLERQDQTKDALAAYQQAVSIDPELALAQAAIRRLQKQQ